jgi:hypothetical protein
MSTIAPASPSQHYLSLRETGSGHESALQAVAHAYGRTPQELLDNGVANLWDQLQRSEPVAVEQPQDDQRSADPFTAAETGARARIDSLTALRQPLALDAIGSADKRQELDGVEADLAAAESELERIRLARQESAKREREQAQQARQARREKAQARVDELAEQRTKAEQRMARSAADFARAVAATDALSAQQVGALAEAGHSQADRAQLSVPEVRATLVRALASQNVRADWLD